MSSEWRRDPTINPRGFGGLTDRLNRIEQQIRALAGRAGINNATMTGVMRVLGSILVEGGSIVISAGGLIIDGLGRIDVQNGGSILARDRESRELLYVGGLISEGFGVLIRRLDGSYALTFSDDDPSTEQVQRIRILDRTGFVLLEEDKNGVGMDWPRPAMTFQGLSWPGWDGNNTTSFVTIARCIDYKRTPRFQLAASFIGESGTPGEARLLANGVQVGSTVAVAALQMGSSGFGTPLELPGDVGQAVTLELQVRRTAGTGFVRGRVDWCFGMGSA